MSEVFPRIGGGKVDKYLSSESPVVLCFTADWCSPCKRLKPEIEKLAISTPGAMFAQVDVDHDGDVAQRLNVMSVPAVVLFNGGEVVEYLPSPQPSQIVEMLQKHGIN